MFAFPLLFGAAARTDPQVIPWLLRARQQVGRYLINPGLLFVVLAGIYLASKEHQWSSFYVGWGIIAAIVLGALEGSFDHPARRAARRPGRARPRRHRGPGRRAAHQRQWSPEYTATLRRFTLAGNAMAAIVVLTVFFMATHLGA